MSLSLKGRHVLLVAPLFFGYEREIIAELQRRGAEVDLLPDRPFDTAFMKAAARFRRNWVLPAVDRLYRRLLDGFGRPEYDLVLVVNGLTLSYPLLTELRTILPRARFILYMWDSFENRPWMIKNLKFFDSCLSFDPLDAKKHGMKFRPLFFTPGFERPRTLEYDYHLSFVGTAHTDRYGVVSVVDRSLDSEIKRYWYLYLQAPWVFYAYKLSNPVFRSAHIGEFHFHPLASRQVQDIFHRSHAVLDIEHPRQTGLTMRSFEAMGASKKLVTTNAGIRDYDFFDAQNICVIDRQDARISAEFLTTSYRPIDPVLYAKYRIAGWLDEVLESGSTFAAAQRPERPSGKGRFHQPISARSDGNQATRVEQQ